MQNILNSNSMNENSNIDSNTNIKIDNIIEDPFNNLNSSQIKSENFLNNTPLPENKLTDVKIQKDFSKDLNFSINPNSEAQILSSLNPMINNICYSLEKNIKLNPDDLLNDINLSDEETNNDKLNEGEYNIQIEKINEFYDELGDGSMNKYTGTKNEVEDRVNIPVPFELPENAEFGEAGIIEAIFENDKILLKPNFNSGILDLDNILWNSNHIAVGYLDDVVGKVEEPVYIIKFFPNLIDKNLVYKGHPLYFVKGKASTIVKKELLKNKGCDASNAFDEEVSDSEKEFSDDEKEFHYKQMKKKNKNNFKKPRVEEPYGNSYIIESEPINRGINNLKSKYFAENNCNSNNINFGNNNSEKNDFNIHVKRNVNINNNFQMNQNNNNNQYMQNNIHNMYNPSYNTNNNMIMGNNPNPYYSAEYKIGSNPIPPNNNFGMNNNYSNLNINNYNNLNNVSNFIRPMGINPFIPPNMNINNTNNNQTNNNNSNINNN